MTQIAFEHALALHHQGRIEEAACAYGELLLAEPAHLQALIHLGALRLGEGRADDAERLLRRAVTVSPNSPEALGNLGAALQALGRYEEAAARYEQALEKRPGMTDACFGLAACLQATGRREAAVACYQAVLDADPAHPEANYGLATQLEQLGRFDEAVAKYRTALSADPDFAEASYGLGKLLARGTTLEEAVSLFKSALTIDSDYIEARAALGSALLRLERDDEALSAFYAVLAADANHPEAHTGIGTILDRKRRQNEAIEHYRAALVREPEHVEAMAGMANAMKNVGRHAEALAAARAVASLRPDFAPAAGLLGSVLAEIGSIDEAVAQFRRAVTLAPDRPEFAYHLALLAKVRPDDAALTALEANLPRSASLSAQDQCLLHFGLAKAYDDIGERDRGFTHLLRGNAIKRAQTDYDEATTLGAIEQISRVFSASLIAARGTLGDPSTVPVFIVGMPRSGTTLVEQILASHREIFGAGERSELSQIIKRLNSERLEGAVSPQALWAMPGEKFQDMGAEYLASIRPLAPGAARITDKMPNNFLNVGLISLILPNARIIHVQRDPVDTCLSCFSKLFAGEQAFTYDFAELGRFYRSYERLMTHWRAVLPDGILLDVKYEALIENFEPEARRLVAHCGLEWDPACLAFHKTDRPVHTASMIQVRQPIYRSSVGRWRPDADLIRPLLDALAGG